jgi:hypothetical protein
VIWLVTNRKRRFLTGKTNPPRLTSTVATLQLSAGLGLLSEAGTGLEVDYSV